MNTRLVLLLLAFCAIATASIAAEEAKTSSPPPASIVPTDNPGSFDPAAATQAWLDTVPAEKRAKSDAYFEGGYWLILWNVLLTVVISIFLLQSRISASLRNFAERCARFRWLQVAIYVVGFVIIMAVLSFPLAVYEQFFREHKYGLATQTFGPWFLEQIKALGVALVAAPIALIILYAVFRRAPRTWSIWGAVVGVALAIFGAFIAPIYVEPIFNSYKPLTDPATRDPILAMARANEIPVQQVFVVDASRQTTRVSANVAGFFGTTRIALNDNLLKQCTLPEIRMVMAHEMGHYILNHGAKLVTYAGIFFLVGFALVSKFFNAAVQRWGGRWGVHGIGDPAGLPLLLLLLSILSFLATPLSNTVVRVTEREADAFGVNTSREPDGFAMVSLKLGAYRKLNPGPVEEFIFFDHPSGRARIRMAMDWKAARLPPGDGATKTAIPMP